MNRSRTRLRAEGRRWLSTRGPGPLRSGLLFALAGATLGCLPAMQFAGSFWTAAVFWLVGTNLGVHSDDPPSALRRITVPLAAGCLFAVIAFVRFDWAVLVLMATLAIAIVLMGSVVCLLAIQVFRRLRSHN